MVAVTRPKAIINIRFTEIVKIVGGAYCYNLPTFLMPDYKNMTFGTKIMYSKTLMLLSTS